MTKYFFTVCICTILLLVSCGKDSDTSGEREMQVYKELLNVSYGSAGEQKADVYLPAGRDATTKTIILIHGGGWTAGDKSDMASLIPYFVDMGYAVVNMNYRLVKALQDKYPAQLDDVRLVVNMVLAKKGEYVISDKLGMAGTSAGAHLSLLYAYAYNDGGHVKAVASISAPTDLEEVATSTNTALTAAITYLFGSTYAQNPQLWRDASPRLRATSGSVPTLMFAGSEDPLVYPVQSQLLADKLSALGVVNKLVIYQGEGHSWVNPLNWLDTAQQIDSWFTAYVK